MTAVIAMASGKSKAGRTLLSANLAHYLSHKGYPTGLLVAGASTPLWGIAPDSTWPNIIGGRLSIDHAVHRDTFGIDVMVAQGHGHALGNLSTQTAEHLADPIGILDSYAYLIVDMTAGISAPAIACCLAASEAILVVTPEASSLTAGYDWLAKLTRYGFNRPANIILNQVKRTALAQSVYIRFRDLAHQRLKLQTNLWGSIAYEILSHPLETLHQPLVNIAPHSRLLQEIRIIGDRLLAEQPPENQTTPLSAFWQQFIAYLAQLPVLPFTPPSGEALAHTSLKHNSPENAATMQASSEKHHATNQYQVLEHLNHQMAAILNELRSIRKLLEIKPPVVPASREAALAEIHMDFDDFISRHEGQAK
jgi:flagellar biosynthesis protein FlhG